MEVFFVLVSFCLFVRVQSDTGLVTNFTELTHQNRTFQILLFPPDPKFTGQTRTPRKFFQKIHSGAAFLTGLKLGAILSKKGFELGHGKITSAHSFQIFGKPVHSATSLTYGDLQSLQSFADDISRLNEDSNRVLKKGEKKIFQLTVVENTSPEAITISPDIKEKQQIEELNTAIKEDKKNKSQITLYQDAEQSRREKGFAEKNQREMEEVDTGRRINNKVYEHLKTNFEIHREKARPFVLRPRARQNFSKIIFLKHFLELECLKENYKKIRFDNLAKKPLKQIRTFPFQYNFPRWKGNLMTTGKYFDARKVMLPPPLDNEIAAEPFNATEKTKTNKHISLKKKYQSKAPGISNSNNKITIKGEIGGAGKNFTHNPQVFSNVENISKYENSFSQTVSVMNYSKVLVEEYNFSKTVSFGDDKKFGKFSPQPSTIATYQKPSSKSTLEHFTRPYQVRPYEKKEFLDESLKVYSGESEVEDLKDKFFDIQNVNFSSGIKDATIEKGKKNLESTRDVIDHSISTILKGLMKPVVRIIPDKPENQQSEVKIKKKVEIKENDVIQDFVSQQQTTSTVNYQITKNNFHKKDYTRQFFLENTEDSKEQATEEFKRYQKFSLPKMTEETGQNQNFISYTPIIFPTNDKNFQQDITTVFFKKNKFPSITNDLTEDYRNLEFDLTKKINELTTKTENPSSLFHKAFKTLSQEKVTRTPYEAISTSSEIKIFTSPTNSIKNLFTKESANSTPDNQSAVKTNKSISSHSTTKYLQQPVGQPVSVDSVQHEIKTKSKQDSNWKNSRKMNFGRKSYKINFPSIITRFPEEQRRSDIIIDLGDYDNHNQLSTLNYLEKLRQNGTNASYDSLMNITPESIIPLVPLIINDFREGKISIEDRSMLSKVFGKYWSYIKALSNEINLDMLPLLKMKDEKDLQNVMKTLSIESLMTSTMETPENEGNQNSDYNHSYDYMEEYKNMYQDVLDQERGDKKRKFRPKREEVNDLNRMEATREYFESIQEEEEVPNFNEESSHYIYEDIIYKDNLKNNESLVFEITEIADLEFKIQNVSSSLEKNKI